MSGLPEVVMKTWDEMVEAGGREVPGRILLRIQGEEAIDRRQLVEDVLRAALADAPRIHVIHQVQANPDTWFSVAAFVDRALGDLPNGYLLIPPPPESAV